MSSRVSTGLAISLLTSLAVSASDMAQAQGLPTGGRVTAGSAQIGGAVNGALTIQQLTPKAIVNWDTFSVGQQNSVVFKQPGVSSAILNRVTASTPSTIAGNIRADGQVFLINPNGIAITSTGTVDTRGGFVASTLGITDNDFLAGRYRFTGSGASKPVTNAGTIRTGMGGFVALVGGSVANEGSISTPLGKVGLGSGEAVTVDLFGDNFLSVAMPSGTTAADGTPLKSLVSNSGKIRANGGRVEIKAATVRSAFREAVNMSGTISARSVGGRNGAIVLGGGAGGHVRVSGKINTTARARGTGGVIDISGADVSITGTLAVSGGKGGTIAVNGSGRVAILGELDASGSNGLGGAIGVTAKEGADIGTSASLKASGSTDGGTIRIDGGADLTVAGRLAANGANFGGGIDLTATVTKLSAATVSATGGERGGLVRIGGAFRGGKPLDADDPDVPVYVGRFGQLGRIVNAETTAMDAASTIDVSGGKTGGTAVLWSNRDTSQLGRIVATGSVSGGAVEISAATLSQTDLASVRLGSGGRLLLDPVNMRVNTGDNSEPATESRIGATIEGQIREGASVTLEADNKIIWWNGTSLQNGPVSGLWAPAYGTLTLRAGGSIQFLDWSTPSTFDLSHHAGGAGGNLVIIVNNRNAPVATGGAFIPITGGRTPETPGRDPRFPARFVSQGTALNLGTGSLTITMDKGPADILFPYRSTAIGGYGTSPTDETNFSKGIDTPIPSAGSLSLGWRGITAGSVVMRAYAADSGYVGTGLLRDDAVGYNSRPGIELNGTVTTSGAQSYTGALTVFTSSSVPEIWLRGSAVTWTDEAFNTIRGASGGSNVIRFIENDTTTRYGRMATNFTDAARLALGPAGNVQVYEGEPVAPLHVVRGNLRAGDTPISIAGGTVSIAYDQPPAVGNTVAATFSGPGFALSAGGYFVNMAQRSVQVTTLAGLIPLTYSVLSPTYEYFDPLTAVTLGGLVSGADVRPVVTINGTPLTLDSGAVAGQYLFAATHGVGTSNFTFTGITGADASKYRIALGSDVTGTLTINKIPLAYTIESVSSTYGNSDAAVTFMGVVDGVPIVPVAELTPNGGTATRKRLEPGAIGSNRFGFGRLNAGSYSFTGVELSTNADKYDLTPAAGSPTSGTIDIARKAISASVSPAIQYTYGPSSPTLIAFNGVVPDDSFAVIVNLGGSLVTTNYSRFNDTGYLPERLAARPLTPFQIVGIDGNRSVGAQNYDVTFTSTTGTVVIDKRLLSYDTLKAGTRDLSSLVYGSSLTNLTLGLGNIYSGDPVGPSGDQVAPSAIQILKDGNPVPNRTNGPVVGNYRVVAAGLSGADAANYVLPTVDVSAGMPLAITQRPVTYTAVAGDYAYGQSSSSPIVTTDLLAGDDVRLPTLAQNCAPTCSGATSVYGVTTRVGSYLATAGNLAGADAGNYVLSGLIPGGQSSASINVTPKQLFIGNPDATYRPGEVPTQVVEPLSGLINGDTVSAQILPSLGIGAGWNPGVGSYQILAELTGAGAANYTLNGPNARGGWTVTVTGGVLTYSMNNQTITYGDTIGAEIFAVLSGLVPADAGTVHPVVSLTDSNGQPQPLTSRIVPGTYTVRTTGLSFDNPAAVGGYTLDAAGTLTSVVTVNQRPLTFTTSNVTTTYRTPVSLGTATLSGVLSGDTVLPGHVTFSQNSSPGNYTKERAGTYTLGISFLSGIHQDRYTLAATGNTVGTLTVNRAPLTYNIMQSLQFGYDDQERFLDNPQLSGILGNDILSPVWGIYAPGGARIAEANTFGGLFLRVPRRLAAGTYDLKVTGFVGLGAGDYEVAASGNTLGTLTVDRRSLIVPAGSQRTYGADNVSILLNMLPDDDVSLVNPSILVNGAPTPLTSRTPVGSYNLTIAGIAGSAASNYDLINRPSSLNIQQRALTIDIAPASSTYGTLPILSGAVTSGILPGDDVQVTTVLNRALDARLLVGTYSQSSSISGTAASNYFVPNPPFSPLTVNPKPITYTAGDAQIVYGPSAQQFNPAIFSGILAGDAIPGYTVSTFNSGGTAVTGRLNVGTYSQRVTLDFARNYVLDQDASRPGIVTVTPRSVTVGVSVNGVGATGFGLNQSIEYGFVNPNPVFTANVISGVIDNGIGATATAPVLARSSSGHVQIGSYQLGLTLTGALAGNYTLDLAGSNSTLNIVPRRVAIDSTASPFYGDGPRLSVDPLRGSSFIAGDSVALSYRVDGGTGAIAAGERTPAGIYTRIGPSLTGPDGANYVLRDLQTSPSYVIQPRPLLQQVNNEMVVYGTVPTFTATFLGSLDTATPSVGVLPGDDVRAAGFVTESGQSATARLFAGGYSIRVSGLIGADIRNYTLQTRVPIFDSVGTLTVNPKPLTLTSLDITGTYGDATVPTPTATVAGILSGDQVSVSSFGATGFLFSQVGSTPDGARAPFAPDAGTYTLQHALIGTHAQNYVINQSASRFGSYVIGPKLITATLTTPSRVYGDSADLVITLNGVHPGDPRAVVDVASDPALNGGLIAYYGLPSGSGVLRSTIFNPNGTFAVDSHGNPLVDFGLGPWAADGRAALVVAPSRNMTAGDYILNLTVSSFSNGGRINPANYIIAPVTLHIAPKPITWSVAANPNGLYGGFTKVCSAGECGNRDGTGPGAVTFNGLAYGDRLGAEVSLLGATGKIALNRDTPIGSYLQLVDGLTGDRAPNYRIASTGNSTSLMTIDKGIINYTTSDAVYLHGFGYLENRLGGRPTFTGVRPGDEADVHATVGLFTAPVGDPSARAVSDVTTLPLGTYYYDVLVLHADPTKYVLGTGTRFNHIGTLAVDNLSVFNQTFANPFVTSVTAPAQPQTQNSQQFVSLGQLLEVLTGTSAEGFRPVNTTGGTGTQTNAGVSSGVTSITVGAGAGAGGTASETLGPAELAARTNALTEAIAKAGVTGVTVGVGAGAEGAVRVDLGSGYVEVGSDASAKVVSSISFLNPSLQVHVAARLGAYREVGADGSIGGGLDGSIATRQDEFLLARLDSEYGLTGGTVSFNTSAFVGGGVSNTVSTGIAGDFGSVNTGATLYSPGSLYAGINSSVGFEDDKLKIALSLGVSMGAGGFRVDVSTVINIPQQQILDAAESIGDPFIAMGRIGELFGVGGSSSRPPPCFAYACTTGKQVSDLVYGDRVGNLKGISEALSKVERYTSGVGARSLTPTEQQEYNALKSWYSSYQTSTAAVSQTIAEQKSLVGKFVNTPTSFSVADYRALKASQSNINGAISQLNSVIGVNGYSVAVTSSPDGSTASLSYVKP